MLEAPRMLLAWALLPLNPLEPPLKPLEREPPPDEKSRLPMLLLLALGLRLPLLMELAPAVLARELPAERLLALALAPRLPAPADWVEVPARLPAAAEPRDEPENLSAVALFE